MIIYFIILFIVMLLATFGEANKRYKVIYNFFTFLSFMTLMIFAGLRSSAVGTDTNNYVGFYESFTINIQTGIAIGFASSLEPGYIVLQIVASLISKNYWALLTLIACVALFSTYKTINKLSFNPRISIFLYITLASYVFFFNGARQGLAASVYGIALIYLVQKRLFWYVIWVLIAATFHKTVLIMLPLYFVIRTRFSIFKTLLISISSFIVLTYLSSIVALLDTSSSERYGAYVDRGASGGVLLGVFFTLLAVFLIFIRKWIKNESKYFYDIYLNLCVLTAVTYLVVILTGADVNFIRLSLYFSLGFILIWPIIFRDILIFRELPIGILFFIVHIVFFFIYLSKMSSLVPYQLNPTLFLNF